jgi:hypothetical protein
VRLDVTMKSGGPWNRKSLRPDARAATRDAARRSGMSVGEWLNSVSEPTQPSERAARWSGEADGPRPGAGERRDREEFRDRDARRDMDLPQREA